MLHVNLKWRNCFRYFVVTPISECDDRASVIAPKKSETIRINQLLGKLLIIVQIKGPYKRNQTAALQQAKFYVPQQAAAP